MNIGLRLFGREIELRTKAIPLQPLSGRGGWWSVVREPFAGAWQRNAEVKMDTVLTYGAVFACVTLISQDIGKLCLRLVEQDATGIWKEADSPAYSPVLRKPNHYQNRVKFVEQWIVSKLIHGNTYVWKRRDQRGVVIGLYVLDPTRVTPLVATDGSVYYELRRDDLSDLPLEKKVVPASEIIHDTMVALYHPLLGVSPIYACGVAAMQGLKIQANSQNFFANMSRPGGILTAPGTIDDVTSARLKETFESGFGGENIGRIMIAGDGLKFEGLGVNAVDAQLIDQLRWTGENVCTAYHVPPFMVGIGPTPPYANNEPLVQQYYSQCLQSLITSFETCLDEGLGLNEKVEGRRLGTEFDIDDLIWLDAAAKTKAAQDSIGSGGMSPNEARKKYYGLGPVEGGDTPYMQVQNYSLKALAKRDADDPFAKPEPAPVPAPKTPTPASAEEDDDEAMAASFGAILHQKALDAGWTYAV